MQPNESYQIFYYDYSSLNIFVTFPWAAQHTEYPKRIGIERTYFYFHIIFLFSYFWWKITESRSTMGSSTLECGCCLPSDGLMIFNSISVMQERQSERVRESEKDVELTKNKITLFIYYFSFYFFFVVLVLV